MADDDEPQQASADAGAACDTVWSIRKACFFPLAARGAVARRISDVAGRMLRKATCPSFSPLAIASAADLGQRSGSRPFRKSASHCRSSHGNSHHLHLLDATSPDAASSNPHHLRLLDAPSPDAASSNPLPPAGSANVDTARDADAYEESQEEVGDDGQNAGVEHLIVREAPKVVGVLVEDEEGEEER